MDGVHGCLEQHRRKSNHQTENTSIKIWGEKPKFRKSKLTWGALCRGGKRLDLIAVKPLPYSVWKVQRKTVLHNWINNLVDSLKYYVSYLNVDN